MYKKLLQEIMNGRGAARAMMNVACDTISLEGNQVLDVGSGKKKSSYHKHFSGKLTKLTTVDLIMSDSGEGSIDFEKDTLPYENDSYDTVLCFNLLEHLYNYKNILTESNRVLKKEGRFIGFVPFMVNYHPDPRDFFRYTNESLEKIFKESNFSNCLITPLAMGPYMVHFNNTFMMYPRIIRVLCFTCAFMIDSCLLRLKPQIKGRYALGYFFEVTK